MVILTNYRVRSDNGINYIVSKERPPCPTCGGTLRPRARTPRKVIDADGETSTYLLRRLRCRDCDASHLALPDFIVPHKRYTRQAIEMAISDVNSSCVAELSTILRWRKEMKIEKT